FTVLGVGVLAPSNARANDTHLIRPGETLSYIAAMYGMSVQALAELNGISNTDLIFAGATLRLNGGTGGAVPVSTTASTQTYVVAPGDTLSAIAVRFRVALSLLVEQNGISNPNHILVGQVLGIPGAALQVEAPPP